MAPKVVFDFRDEAPAILTQLAEQGLTLDENDLVKISVLTASMQALNDHGALGRKSKAQIEAFILASLRFAAYPIPPISDAEPPTRATITLSPEATQQLYALRESSQHKDLNTLTSYAFDLVDAFRIADAAGYTIWSKDKEGGLEQISFLKE